MRCAADVCVCVYVYVNYMLIMCDSVFSDNNLHKCAMRLAASIAPSLLGPVLGDVLCILDRNIPVMPAKPEWLAHLCIFPGLWTLSTGRRELKSPP